MPSEAAQWFAAAFRSELPKSGGDIGDGGDTPGGAAEIRRFDPAAPIPGRDIAGGDSGDILTGDTTLSPLSPVWDRQAGTLWAWHERRISAAPGSQSPVSPPSPAAMQWVRLRIPIIADGDSD